MSLIVQANLLLKQNKIKQAESLYRQLLTQNPNNIDALWGLGKVALALDSYQPSYDIFKRCVQLVANASPLWLSLAQSCQKLQRFEEAEQALLTAYEIKKDSITTLLSLAIFYCQSNQLVKAKKYLDVLFSIAPNNIRAFCLKVRINVQVILDDHAQNFLDKLADKTNDLTQKEQVLLHYAFAQLYQQSSNYKQAFYHFTQANKLQALQVSFSVDDMENYFSQLMKVFSSTFINKIKQEQAVNLSQIKKPLLTPIFIVGQPRSGSTLLEQMLISHTDINSAGELPFLAGDIAQGVWQLTKQEFPHGCAHLTVKQRESLAHHYLTNMQALAPKAKFIIDKMPANYQSIGLIKMLFPYAKVIHISRAVKDVSWSIFTNHFDAPEPYFCSLSEIVLYHKNYQQVMSHWQQVLPEFIYNISYESLVASPKESLTKLLGFCSLSYQEECLSFEHKSRHIDTLSDIQLRNGLKNNIAKAWLPYQKYLPACFNELC
ncbi:sulfotransferase [Colwellia sp. 4_MG-2023]|uniref:tetratricopeptide repeat-containing sulfotransferase family protein n=1 Tax=unclassified Colwellia TaxID=196834 RepID=UPI0026E2B9FD|nr:MULTISPECIES: tetratricopeptide repeat-containing sulfotransferase family protein [unclassified Colwellia]MDO6506324.1 sulfotransferase [Colwellia sp. 5_MG-2023]MDO6555148.1 sulfotransferase [Colwellia sp. 4_MG-2023]